MNSEIVSKLSYNNIFVLLLITVILLLTSALSADIPTDTRKDGLVSAGIDGTCMMDSIVIKRYDIFPGYSECGETLDSVKKYNSNSLVMLYNSGTDNYTTPNVTTGNYYGSVEHNWLVNRCTELGYTPEILYLHFYEDTDISGWSIPGTYSTSVNNSDNVCRAPDYLDYYNGDGVGRILVNYSHPVTRQLCIEYATMVFDSLYSSMWRNLNGRTTHFDGIYLDNMMHNWGRRGYGGMGRIDAGGRIVETPNAGLIYGTVEFADWYWIQMKAFTTALRDTLEQAASWAPDGKRKYLALNVGQSWSSDYADPNVAGADYLVMEFLYSPVNNPNASIYGLPGMASKDSMSAINDVHVVYCSRQMIGDNGEYSWGDAVYNNLAGFYTLTSGESYLFQRAGLGAPYSAQYNPHFDSLAWRGCMDYDLGYAAEHYQVYDTGTDPKGQSYKVFKRLYQKGLVMMRPLDDWGQEFDDATNISVSLPGAYRRLAIDGSLGPVVTSIALQNGSGAILIPADMGDCSAPPTTPSLYSPSNGSQVGSRPTLCVNNANGGDCQVSLTYDFQIASNSTMSSIVTEKYGVSQGSSITCYTPSIDLNSGQTFYWRARAYNGTASSGWSSVRSFTVEGSVNSAPGAPTPSSPANLAEITTSRPLLTVVNSYDPDGDNLTYQFQVSSNSAFSSVVSQVSGVSEGTSTTSWTVSATLLNGSSYYWRTRAYDGSAYSSWSAIRVFTVIISQANSPPTVPIISWPSHGSIVNTIDPTLRIQNSTDPNGDQITYQIQVSISQAFNVMAAEATGVPLNPGTYTYWTVNHDLTDNEDYWWRVRATDGIAYSTFSQPAQFFVESDGNSSTSEIPEPEYPADNSYIETTAPILVVRNSLNTEGAVLTYFFEVWDEARISRLRLSPVIYENESGLTSWLVDPFLDRGRKYYWRCRSYNQSSYSDWSEWFSFSIAEATGNNPPEVPILAYPDDNDTLVGTSHMLAVLGSEDSDGDVVTYDFRISSTSTMSQIIEFASDVGGSKSTTTAYYTTVDMEDGHKYYWQARAYDGFDYSDWSVKRSFYHFDIVLSGEDIPRPLSPGDGADVNSIRPTFEIQTDQTDIGVKFYFEIADNIEFINPIVSGPVTGESSRTSWDAGTDLKLNQTYFWRVKAEASGWSEVFSFNTRAEAHVSPNPYRPSVHGDRVVFKNIPVGSKIKIATVTGEIVKEFEQTEISEVAWDVTNTDGIKLASGVYLYYVITKDSTSSGKIAVIR